ncbi:caspase b-like isoform X1 [Anoplopoma fimbria]|uniref:caspase b-like isoform X1 n=1 Tax=Anoplopoma fimbria TaxID=229290 RepID=UPI0023ECCC20|nr:caspase b-like isoform X1 [Anoplopoma fimbria]
MLVRMLLLETLQDLINDEFKTFKWHLQDKVLDSCKPIPRSYLENADRTDAVTRMIASYGEEMAVNISVEVLKRMNNNSAAEKLRNIYSAGGNTAASSTSASDAAPPAAPVAPPAAPPAAPATMMAKQGGVIFAPTVAGGTSGTWNITINK